MHFTTILAALVSGSMTTAIPTASVTTTANSTTPWTIKSLRRVCNSADTECQWSFGIDTHKSTGGADRDEPTNCAYIVEGDPASHTNGGVSPCGPFTVSSGYDGQLGTTTKPKQGFTVLAIAHPVRRLIVWAAYTDEQLQGGKVVSPDQTYEPATIA